MCGELGYSTWVDGRELDGSSGDQGWEVGRDLRPGLGGRQGQAGLGQGTFPVWLSELSLQRLKL